ncbi:nitrogen fixation protein FixH [Saonia flava]|uniref:Nitrogen fixation protein FixH n=1 Tax=Saonia flava TaxID=523696 RepID=A0A846QYN7_9FLAO|nr:FixH family protein [Saonia flava]NJB71323.1 nitrogen fixation protein FixH [Saonia flava]
MKINWGTGIVLSFIAFIGFILFFVVKMSTDNKANHDLVTEEYYKAELEYQKEIDAEKNSNALSEKIEIEKTSEGLVIKFPKEINYQRLKGTISLYRPSNKHLDFNLPISLSTTHLLIPDKRLLDGRWDIKISWEENGKSFLHKESITY